MSHRDSSKTPTQISRRAKERAASNTRDPDKSLRIGMGRSLAAPALPHHLAYGSVPRRFGWLDFGFRLFQKQTEHPVPSSTLPGRGEMFRAGAAAVVPDAFAATSGLGGKVFANAQTSATLRTDVCQFSIASKHNFLSGGVANYPSPAAPMGVWQTAESSPASRSGNCGVR